jgi:hypothetical protein
MPIGKNSNVFFTLLGVERQQVYIGNILTWWGNTSVRVGAARTRNEKV